MAIQQFEVRVRLQYDDESMTATEAQRTFQTDISDGFIWAEVVDGNE